MCKMKNSDETSMFRRRKCMFLKMSVVVLLVAWLLLYYRRRWLYTAPDIKIEIGPRDSMQYDSSAKTFSFKSSNEVLAKMGLSFPNRRKAISCSDGDECFDYGVAQLTLHYERNCVKLEWTSKELRELKDCINVLGSHWYGGGSQFEEPWPVEKSTRAESYLLPGYSTRNKTHQYSGIVESYWVSSRGIAVKVDESVPLFFSMPDINGDGAGDQLCFSARFDKPYVLRSKNSPLHLTYHMCFADNIRQVYDLSFKKFFSLPKDIPDERMFTHPVWSTWAQFKKKVDATKTLDMARSIVKNGFSNSQIQIDDNWEECYGDAVFSSKTFPNPKEMVDTLHALGFRVTLWIHPFILSKCQSFHEADAKGYFIKNSDGKTQYTTFAKSTTVGLLDFTNPDAVSWWRGRLVKLKNEVGIDGFKFDDGEIFFMPENYTLSLEKENWPGGYVTSYINAVSKFGPMVEMRVGHGSQDVPIFVRPLDKNTNWYYEKGLLTLIPSLLHHGLLGYPFILPDMVAGNAYKGKPSQELFIRWAQANTFMPAIQFSLLPWDIKQDDHIVTKISLEVSKLHAEFAPLIIQFARNATLGHGPIVRPTWWLCPLEESCLTADQQFLLGDDILVTPVMHEGATTLTVVFPPGKWKQADNGDVFEGHSKQTIPGITIRSNIYFRRVSS